MLMRLLLMNALVLGAATVGLLFVVDENAAIVAPPNIASLEHITLAAYPSGF